ncbi:putative peptidase [Kibdelosporangium banguiense]|uniref:Peptidase n=1 Tax=Kibdelosporangium banguiense TaxID=1365924 RepID=A0ABS4TTZ4_9PSEU|nr:alpha/beta hydrolase-fold protein [Kibdelosporangium banguiense]MBP2327867.1 putative peptidase [Kibdelosporangium banguiense]
MIRRRTLLGAGLTVPAVGAAFTGTAEAKPGKPRAIDATVITTVSPVGYKVAGLAIEYDRPVHGGQSPFDVKVTLSRPDADPLTGTRTVVDAYPNNAPEFSEHPRPGRYVILELDENDPLARAAYNEGYYTRFYDLKGAYQVQGVTNTGISNPVVDDYSSGTSGPLPYRFFTPKVRPGRKYPLVVTLHGHGESGTDNFAQIAGNQISVAFANPARPAFVLSPQAPPGTPGTGGWWRSDIRAAVLDLVKATIAKNPAIDRSRVYLTGLSMGSYGSWAFLPENHDLFAGAILVCGAGDETAAVTNLGKFPIWAVHSIDDSVVRYDVPGSDYRIFKALEAAGRPVTWSEWPGTAPERVQEAYAADARARAARSRSKHIFTTFPAGTTPVFSHGSWIPTYPNDVILDWLFDQRRA